MSVKTSASCHENSITGLQKQSSSRGFSLVEVMMQMLLIATVTMPLVMMLNLQQVKIQDSKEDTKNNMLANAIFDNVILEHPDPVDTFKIDKTTTYNYPEGYAGSYYSSIYCDPATRLMDSNYNNYWVCGNQAGVNYGSHFSNTHPFFKRSLEWDNNKLKVTVTLYNKKDDDQSYYQTSREYIMDAFRIHAGSMMAGTSVISGSSTITQLAGFTNIQSFSNKTNSDSAGQLWAPLYTQPASLSGTSGVANNSWFIDRGSCALSGPTSLTGNEFPFNGYVSFTCTSGITAYFPHLVPAGTYDVNLYFARPGSFTTGCIANTTGMSCNLADISILEASTVTSTATTLQDISNVDLYAINGLTTTGKGQVLHTTVKLTQPVMKILIKSTTGSSPVLLSGIEVVRRIDSL